MKRESAGFSLVEVLVAMSVFMIAATAVASLMTHSTSFVSQNNYRSQALTCAQAALEDIRTQAYEDILPTSGLSCVKGSMTFGVQWSVATDSPENGMKTIVVTVSWSEKGASKSYALKTIYSKITA